MEGLPAVGTKVVVTDGKHCGGHPTGTKGVVIHTYKEDWVDVEADGIALWHCPVCLAEKEA